MAPILERLPTMRRPYEYVGFSYTRRGPEETTAPGRHHERSRYRWHRSAFAPNLKGPPPRGGDRNRDNHKEKP